ncbi:MAG TPA: sigma-70 family RNA polymerase sigma factor [Gemmataceae bacterium]|nr:sigma-70 family RNA polymerase sigma factor [Gemmataceae bacterium]
MDDAPGNQDADLVQAWQRGDAAAFAALVRRWQQPMARFLAAMVGRTDLVQDLCQEVFLRVFLAKARYRESGTFSSWLYRIAGNVARDACRRRRPEPQRLLNRELNIPSQGPEAQCENQELVQALAGALAELPLALREVVVLRHYEEMNFKEISQLLGIPAGTLRSRFEVGMERLRIRLKQQGWNPLEDRQ